MIKHDQPEHEPHLPYLAIFSQELHMKIAEPRLGSPAASERSPRATGHAPATAGPHLKSTWGGWNWRNFPKQLERRKHKDGCLIVPISASINIDVYSS